jgi:hypothetical protein
MRHYRDAAFLLDGGRLDNAAYLAGYVVECSFKAVIQCGDRIAGQSLGHDLKNIAGRALALAAVLAPGLQRYQVGLNPDVEHVLGHWRPELRYGASGRASQEEAGRLIRGGQACLAAIIIPLVLDGIVGIPR